MLDEAFAIAEQLYELLPDFPEEERWDAQSKLRTVAIDLLYYMAQAIGDVSPSSLEYDWSNVRKQIVTIKALYRFIAKQEYTELEPEFMVRLNTLEKLVDEEVATAYAQTEAHNEMELQQLREKYELFSNAHKQVER